jgi:hypothetical protein
MANSKNLIFKKKFIEGGQGIFNAFRTSLTGSFGYFFSRI